MGQADEPDNELVEKMLVATELLEAVARDRSALGGLTEAERIRFLNAAGDVFAPDVEDRRQRVKARRRRERTAKLERDEARLTETGIRRLRARPVFTSPNVFPPENFDPEEGIEVGHDPDVGDPQHCYVCKAKFTAVHHFYDQLCPACAAFNFDKRTETADLKGRVALLTGGRVKIGYQAGIKLLRSGAEVIVTTRFPRDSALRYSREPDFDDWSDRLTIFGLDLRHTPSVEAFCHHLNRSRSRLDFIVNNACQTVRRPPAFYTHMMELESGSPATMPEAARSLLGGLDGLRGYHLLAADPNEADESEALVEAGSHLPNLVDAAGLSQVSLLPGESAPQGHLFPVGRLDQDLQQVDLRDRNSWRLSLAEVSSIELLETQLVNAVAPFVLNARLKPLMMRTPERDKHIVNVSAVEGQFYRRFKTTRHPHTNMAKAALNMMTPYIRGRIPGRWHSHEQCGHRLGERRRSGRDR